MPSQRTFLSGSVTVYGGNDGRGRTFRILNEGNPEVGGSVICYEASYGSSGRGILKEFFPLDSDAFVRNSQGSIVPSPGMEREFDRAAEEYLRPYRLLAEARTDPANEDLRTFIPDFEVFRGMSGGEFRGTVYIWEPLRKLLTFEEKCRQIRENPSPESDILLILKAVLSLTGCVRALHCVSLIHRDLCPGNFGFTVRNREILTESVTIFDINTVCSLRDAGNVPLQGHIGYTEIPGSGEIPGIGSDLYAIGAILFRALVIPEKNRGVLYRPEDYERIPDLLKESVLLRSPGVHPDLHGTLTGILQKCLGSWQTRYDSCEELIPDLTRALQLAIPAGISGKLSPSPDKIPLGDPGTWKKISAYLNRSRSKNAARILQYHLSEYPLYRLCTGSDPDLHLLLIGCGQHGSAYLDLCLQICQIPGLRLHVTVLSADPEDKQRYLSARPALTGFFDVDGSLTDCRDSYGSIRFLTGQLTEKEEKNRELLSSLPHPIHGIFIAAGSDSLNASAAKTALSFTVSHSPGAVSYISETEDGDPVPGAVRVFTGRDVRSHPMNGVFERMAFNAHILWEKQLNLNYSEIEKNYRKPYNHDSCISMVLSVQYKLYAISSACSLFEDLTTLPPECRETDFRNADFHRLDLQKIAEEFADSGYYRSVRYKAHRDELICSEHRRWVTEKLCAGLARLDDFEPCMTGSTKTAHPPRHLCLRRSRPGQPLSDSALSRSRWDHMTDGEMAALDLDELDILSVKLHQAYLKRAEELLGQNLPGQLDSVREAVKNSDSASLAFQEWYACLLSILEKNRDKISLYQSLKQAFLTAAEDALPGNAYTAVRQDTEAFETKFYPILAAGYYRDFKRDDAVLIERLPFILTYSRNIGLIIPFAASDDNTDLFRFVSAATRVNPKQIVYLIHLETYGELQLLRRSLESTARYLDRKNLSAELNLILTYSRSGDFSDKSLNRALDGISARIRQVKFLPVSAKSEISGTMLGELIRKKKNGRIMLAETNETTLSCMLECCGFFASLRNALPDCGIYTDDADQIRFRTDTRSSLLRYLPKAFLTVADMMSFRHSGSRCGNPPGFSMDYDRIFGEYQSHPSAWEELCTALRHHGETADVLTCISRNSAGEPQELRYGLPSFCAPSARKLITALTDCGIPDVTGTVLTPSADTCEVSLRCPEDCRDGFDQLFANPYALTDPEKLRVRITSRNVTVSFSSLLTDGFSMDTYDLTDEHYGILEFLYQNRHLNNLRRQGRCISFTYASHSVRELMTCSGQILELYTYHSCRKQCCFDDVVCGYGMTREAELPDPGVRMPFGCILTKGFRSLFVECQSSRVSEEDSCCRLAVIARQYGIHASAVLIAAPGSGEDDDSAVQREHQNTADVIIIRKPEEIRNIGSVLESVMDGTYPD